MNNFFKSLVFVFKIIISAMLLWLAASFGIPNGLAQILGSFLFYFIAFATIFICFFQKKFFARYPKLNMLGKILFAVYIFCLAFTVVEGVMGLGRIQDRKKTQEAVDFITSKKIVLLDVFGNNLPPKPDQKLNDSTVAGIDANHNFIRDDVELAIFNKYPDSAKIRAAELQYAQALQLELTQVVDSATLIATIQKEELAYGCLSSSSAEVDRLEKELSNSILNTDLRKKRRDDVFQYLTTHGYKNGPKCDIDSSSLPN